MSDDVCRCGHGDEDHDNDLGFCRVARCRCVLFRNPHEEEEPAADVEDLNFDDDGEPDFFLEPGPTDWESGDDEDAA